MNTDTIERRDGLAMRLADEADRRDDRLNRAEAELSYEFQRSVELGDPDATPDWTGFTPDYDAARKLRIPFADKQRMPRRRVAVHEAFAESLDYGNGPDHADVLRVLTIAMHSSDPMVSLAARQLVKRCADKYAQMNWEDEE